jgi:hypothetical protein
LHQQATSKDQYFKELRNYLIKEIYAEIKLNLPSFGPINQTKHKSLFLPQFLQSYVQSSPVPVVNYQRSYLQLLDEIAREYVNGGKRDIAGRVNRRILRRENPHLIKAESVALFQVKINSFLSDILFIFSDFDENGAVFGQECMEQQIIDPEEVEDPCKRDEFLARYQGIVFCASNLKFGSICDVKKGIERRSLRSKKTEFELTFMRLSAINTDSLFNIRSGADENSGPFQMTQYKSFATFFELTSDMRKRGDEICYEKLLNGFKTLFPQYILENEQIKHAIAEATGLYDTLAQSEVNLLSDRSMQVEDYFKFSENDTIAIVSKIKYSQNKRIDWSEEQFS